MSTHYLEVRRRVKAAQENIISDLVRHLYTRQYLGTAVVVCATPSAMMALTKKQWLKLARQLQQQRADSFEADAILKYTRIITHMQHMFFTTGPVHGQPGAYVVFAQEDQVRTLPSTAFSLYLTTPVTERSLGRIIADLPPSGLVVDYAGQLETGDYGLRPRNELEAAALAEWSQAEKFLQAHGVSMDRLLTGAGSDVRQLDLVMDSLLDVSTDFLHVAQRLQRALDIARPLRAVPKIERRYFELFFQLAKQVQALTPGGAFAAPQFNAYIDETMFLHDAQYWRDTLWPDLADEFMQPAAAGASKSEDPSIAPSWNDSTFVPFGLLGY